MTNQGQAEPIETYTDYYSYGGYQFEITAMRLKDPDIQEVMEGEWNVVVDCPEQPELSLRFQPTDLRGADTAEQVIGRARDAIERYVDQHPGTRPTEVP